MNKKIKSILAVSSAPACFAVITMLFAALPLNATIYYWDSNGSVAGSGSSPSGTWGVDPFWSTSSGGTVETFNTSLTSADDAVFSAGSDASGDYTITLDGSKTVRQVWGKNGNVLLTGGALVFANQTASIESLRSIYPGTLTVDSTIQVTNSHTGDNYLLLRSAENSTIVVNGAVTAAVNNAANKIILRQSEAGEVIFNTDLGSDAAFKTALQAGYIQGAVGTLTLNGTQNLGSTSVNIFHPTYKGVVNIGDTVTSSEVTLGSMVLGGSGGIFSDAVLNVNSVVSLGSGKIDVRMGTMNVGGSVTTTGITSVGIPETDPVPGGTLKILNGGIANLNSINVSNETELIVAGTLSGGTLTLGKLATNGTLILGDETGAGTATLTRITTTGTGTGNRIIGGNSENSTLTVNNAANGTFSGRLGGDGVNENNLSFVKGGAAELTFSAQNTYTGDTQINSGTLVIAEGGSLHFRIGNSGENNGVTGTEDGSFIVSGIFTFDLTAAAAIGNWNIVDVGNLDTTFSPTFSVQDFDDQGDGTWQRILGEATYTFDVATGNLVAIPEASTWVLPLVSGILLIFLRRLRR